MTVDLTRGARHSTLVTLFAAVVSGCGIFESEACHHGISYDVDPREVTIAVGDSFIPFATIETCRYGVEEMTLEWIPEDPGIVTVQAGRVTGIEEGETVVRGQDGTGFVPVEVAVTVLPSIASVGLDG